MIYTVHDIRFEELNPIAFERLCFELLLKLGYKKLSWRQGGADNGRDIEGVWPTETPLSSFESKCFFECKHYAGGVPPEALYSKIAWADAHYPDFLVFFISSYLSTGARTWLELTRSQKRYRIVVIEGEELKHMLSRFPDLVETHFSVDRYNRLLLDARRHWQTYHIVPSYQLLYELINNIDPPRLTKNELGFLIIGYYKLYESYIDPLGDESELIDIKIERLYSRLKEFSTGNAITLFDPYRHDYDFISGNGFWDELEEWIPDFEDESETFHQYNSLHLNYRGPRESWVIGHYVFFRTSDGDAFELFSLDDSEFTTEVRYYSKVDLSTIDELCLKPSPEFRVVLQRFAKVFRPE